MVTGVQRGSYGYRSAKRQLWLQDCKEATMVNRVQRSGYGYMSAERQLLIWSRECIEAAADMVTGVQRGSC